MPSYRPLNLPLDLDNWERLNDNFKRIGNDIENVATAAFDQVIDDVRLDWKDPVDTVSQLGLSFPNPEKGWTSMARDTGKVYRFNGEDWAEIQQIDAGPFNELDNRLNDMKISVSYEMFGAVGDGVADDGPAIKLAHEYANANNIPVLSKKKTYRIGMTSLIPVLTDVDWNDAKILLDEDESPSDYVFVVKSAQDPIDITPTFMTTVIGRNTKEIPELSAFGKVLVYFENANKKQHIRYGVNNDLGYSQRDVAIVNNGKVETDLVWNFDQLTTVTLYPIDDTKRTIKNVTFVSKLNTTTTSDSYMNKSLRVNRSNTILDNVTHVTVDAGVIGRPNNGFFNVGYCANVELRNCVASPRKVRNNQSGTALIGTYDITLYNVANVTFDNVQGFTLDESYWGVTGCNYVKNWTIKNSKMNRIDCHKSMFGLTVKDSVIGKQGIKVTGGGKLEINNLYVYADYVLDIRNDYGSTWDGDIYINKVEHHPFNANPVIFRVQHTLNHDFGYECRFGDNIIDVKDYALFPATAATDYPLLPLDVATRNDGNGLTTNSYQIANQISFTNCSIKTSSNSFYLFDTIMSNLRSKRAFKFNVLLEQNIHSRMLEVENNVSIVLDNVQFSETEKAYGHLLNTASGVGLSAGDSSDTYLSILNRVVPKIEIRNCKNLKLFVYALPSIIVLNNSVLKNYYASQTGTRNVLYINDSNVSITAKTTENAGYGMRVNRISSYFKNVQFTKPKLDGVEIVPTGASSNDNAFRKLFDMFMNVTSGVNDFVVYGNFTNCLFDPAMNFALLVSTSYTRQDFSKIGNTRFNDRFIWGTANTASRPTNPPLNFMYFDTGLNKPIWWNGTAWKDSAGTTV